MGISFRHRGSFKNTEKFLKKAEKTDFFAHLEKFGEMGVEALRSATPVDSGLTADSWGYEITHTNDECRIEFTNSNLQKGWFNVAIMLQFGHGTRNGGWVQGRDYINPAIQPIFDQIAEDAWNEVSRA